MLVARRLRLRVFLEGIEVPCISGLVQVSPNSPAACAVQVVPTEAVNGLKPRTMIHVFYLKPNIDVNKPPVPDDQGSTLRDYNLFFCGDVVGMSYAKTPSSRQCVLQCVDLSSYWDTAYQFYISVSNLFQSKAALWGGGSVFGSLTKSHMGVLNTWLKSKPITPGLDGTTGLLGGIIATLEGMGGIRNQKRGVNDFFTIAELKNNLLQQLMATQHDSTETRLFSQKTFMAWLMQGMGGLGQICTFRDILKFLFKHIYYDVIPNPIAQYIPKVKEVTSDVTRRVTTGVWPTAGEKQEILSLIAETAAASRGMRAKQRYRPNRGGGNGLPAENQTVTSDDYIYYGDPPEAIDRLKVVIQMAGKRLPLSSQESLLLALVELKKISAIVSRGQYSQGANDAYYDMADDMADAWRDASVLLRKSLSTTNRGKTRSVTTTYIDADATLDRLPTQIFRPECFFAAPPKCNVMFPEQYTQYSYERSFLQEPTRLWMSIGTTFVGSTLAGWHPKTVYAPNRKKINELAKAQGNKGLRSLLPWEIYTGILPKFEMVSDLSHMSAASEWKFKTKTKGWRGAATRYAQRAADFNFLRSRLAGRTASLTSTFNPNIVAGFPGVIIDRPFIPLPEELRAAIGTSGLAPKAADIQFDEPLLSVQAIAEKCNAPVHALGNIVGFTHSIGQDGGVTNVMLTHVRGHRLNAEDYLVETAREMAKITSKRMLQTVYDADALLSSGTTSADLDNLYYATSQEFSLQDLDSAPPETPRNMTPLQSRSNPATGNTTTQTSAWSGRRLVDYTPVDRTSIDVNGDTRRLLVKPNGREIETGRTINIPTRYTRGWYAGAKGPRGGIIRYVEVPTPELLILDAWDFARHTSNAMDYARAKAAKKLPTSSPSGRMLLWRKLIIHEEVDTSTTFSDIPIEEALRPIWISPLYSNWLIGQDVYQPFFGVDSVVDRLVVQFEGDDSTSIANVAPSEEKKLREDIKAAGKDATKINQILAAFRPGKLSKVPDVESSINALAYLYGKVKQSGMDVHAFIESYTSRPIATMEDMFGSADLKYDIEYVPGKGKPPTQKDYDKFFRSKLISGKEGFHSRAILPYDNLLGLIDTPDAELPGRFKQNKAGRISLDLDPRPGRRAAVEAYVQSLQTPSAALIVGLKG